MARYIVFYRSVIQLRLRYSEIIRYVTVTYRMLYKLYKFVSIIYLYIYLNLKIVFSFDMFRVFHLQSDKNRKL
jgi:hypothetical protein